MKTNEVAPERTWTEVGSNYNGSATQRGLLAAAIEKLAWEPREEKLPYSQGVAINAAIDQLRIPKVSQIAYHGAVSGLTRDEEACYGVYGIEGNYENGVARVYLLDTGSNVVVVASDFWANAEAQ